MTVEVNDTLERYTISGNGPYAFSWRIFDEDDLTVTALDSASLDPVVLTVNSHFTVTGVNDEDGGSITLIGSTATTYAGDTLDIRSNTPLEQPSSIKNQGSFAPQVHETAFDRLSRQVQDLQRQIKQSWRYPDNVNLDAAMTTRDAWSERYPYVNANGVIEPATNITGTALTQSIIGETLYPRTPAEIAAGVVPVNYNIESHDACGRVYPERYGDSGNATALANALLVSKQSGDAVWVRPATYTSASTLLTLDQDDMKVHLERGVLLSYSGTGNAVKFTGCLNSVITGEGNVYCSNTAATAVLFEPTVDDNCLFNNARFHRIQGGGRGAAPGTLTNAGVEFDRYNVTGNKIVYWNTVECDRIIDVNTGVLFDAPNSDAGNGANGNRVRGIMYDNVWYGEKHRAIENFSEGCQMYGAPGDGSDFTYLYYIENGSFYNHLSGGGGEPGLLSKPYYIEADCDYNYINMQTSNFSTFGVDLGDGNKIETGRELYKMSVSTGDALTENTSYRFGKVALSNTSAATINLRWRSRNTANGYYSSGEAKILAWNQGGVTVTGCEGTFRESGDPGATRSIFRGVIVSGNDIFFVFSVRNFGGANATTGIDIDLDCLGAETRQTGPTTEAGSLTMPVSTTINFSQSVADDGVIKLPNTVEGFGTVSAGAETMLFNVVTTGAVVRVTGTANTVATDTDTNLCVYDAGTFAEIKNRLGSTQTVKGSFTF